MIANWMLVLVTLFVFIVLGVAAWYRDWGAFGSVAITFVILGSSLWRDRLRNK